VSPYTKEALEAQVDHWRKEAERHRKARFAEALIGLVALGLLISFTLWYTAWSQAQSDARWCELIAPLDDRQQKIPNPTPEQKDFAGKMHVLRVKLHCPPTRPSPPQPSATPTD
jgi:hypothetical protein